MSNDIKNIKIPIIKTTTGSWNNDVYYSDNIKIYGEWLAIKSPGFETVENPQDVIYGSEIFLYKKDTNGNNWIYNSKIISPDINVNSWDNAHKINSYISMFENYLIVGVKNIRFQGNNHRGGIAYIYEKSSVFNDDWIRTGLTNTTSDKSKFDSLALYNNFAMLGDTKNNEVHVLKRAETINIVSTNKYYDEWSTIQKIKDIDLNGFGYNIHIKDNLASIAYFDETFDINEDTISYEGGLCMYKKNTNDDNWNKIDDYEDTSINFNNTHIINGSYSVVGDSVITTNKNLNDNFTLFAEDENINWDDIIPLLNNRNSNFFKFAENSSTDDMHVVIENKMSTDLGSSYIFNDTLNTNWNISKDLSSNHANNEFGWSSEVKSNYFIFGNPLNNYVDDEITTGNFFNPTLSGVITKISKERLQETFNMDESKVEAMISTGTTETTDGKKVADISIEVKNAIVQSEDGVEETKENISSKRQEFLKILFANNEEKKIQMTATDIGLDKTFKDTVSSGREIKQNVIVFKVEEDNPEPISVVGDDNQLDDDTGLYVELNKLNKPIVFDIDTGYNVSISKTQDATDDGEPELYKVNYKSIDYIREEGEQITVGGATFYIGSVYLDNISSGIPEAGIFHLLFARIRDDIHYLPDSVSGTEVEPISILTVNDKTSENLYLGQGSSKTFYIDGVEAPILHLIVGKTYKFNQEDSTNDSHTMKFYTDVEKTQLYEFDVVYNGTPGNTNSFVQITPNKNTPGILYYQSSEDDKMGSYFVVTFVNQQLTTTPNNKKIHKIRHEVINKLWNNNPTKDTFITNSKDIALDITVGKPIKETVQVYKPANDLEINLGNVEIVNKKKGIYVDLNNLNDLATFRTSSRVFKIKVMSINPKEYMFRNNSDTLPLYNIRYRDGQWTTIDGITFYFGGIYTGGTNDGITAADPYVFPINGNPYKLPDKSANYCLYADKNTFITGVVDSLSKENQEEMTKWVIERIGSAHNNGAKLVTDGYFYSKFHINTRIGELYLDMESKVCNTNNKDGFTVKFKNSRDNTELFKGEHKTTATISWRYNNDTISIDVDFFENPQIRNGIRMNTVMTTSKRIGLLVEDYEPSLLEVSESKNTLSMYNILSNKLKLGKRVHGEKLNLQKEGELWTRHNK